jgi:GH35 family endo-1,4-beta-xylanase
MTATHPSTHKLDLTLTVRRPDGSPLASQEITLAQTRHRFLFGSNGFDLVSLANQEYHGEELEQAQARAEKLLALFNAVTLPFYWSRFEPQLGNPDTQRLKRAAEWCAARGLSIKGHPLCWHTLTADWLLSLDTPEILQAQLQRIHRDVSAFRGLIDTWDVVNEAVIMPIFDKYDNGITRLCQSMGRIRLIKATFEAARAENPTATLFLNDFDVSPAYDILVEGCLEAGVRIDAIGIQTHMHQGYWGAEKTQAILERFSRFNLPIHFTETTLISGRLMPPEIVDLNDYQVEDWPSTPEGEARQAEDAVQHYRTLFAHPLVQGITWWDFTDGGWLNAPGGLLCRDGSPKPAYTELLKLVKGEWWLPPTRMATDPGGVLRVSVCPGNYELAVGSARLPFTLIDTETEAIEVRLPD